MKILLGAAMNPPYQRTPKQKEVLGHPARFKIWKAGRRGAKTYAEADFLACNALSDRRRDKHWYVTKTLALAREEFFPVLLNLLPRDLVSKIDDRSLNVRLTTGATIWCKSSEKEDNLRGRGLGSVVMDEAAFLKGHIWDRILRPQLAGSKGPGMIASSPKKGWFTALFNDKTKNPHKDWATFHSTIYDNPHMSREEIEAIKSSTPLNTWLQEYMAEEVSEEGQVYAEFSARNIYDPREKFTDIRKMGVIRGLDHGTDAETACAWIGITSEGYLVIFDEYSEPGSDYSRHAEKIHSKSQGLTIKGNVLDRSAFRDIGNGSSMAGLYADEGIRCEESQRDVDASIGIMRRFINGDGTTPWLYVSARCEKTIKAFQEWEQGDHEPDIAAAGRYGVVHAVVKKATSLHAALPTFKHGPPKPVSEAEAAYQFAAHARVAPTRRPTGFSWDFSNGVPS